MSASVTSRGGSRQRVLGALRRGRPAPSPLPDYAPPPSETTKAQRFERFASVLRNEGSHVVRVASAGDLSRALEPALRDAASVVSAVEGVASTLELASAHEAAEVDVCVAPARFGVAENGALWCDAEGLAERSALFLCQHLVLVVSFDAIVATLHDAYERLALQRGWCRERAWAGFIAGPSKTADIEQALVVGAHGARSLLVVVVGEEAPRG